MIKFPAISVVIPMYNAEKFIGDCLESILAQTFQDFEVIIVDDCSTDNSIAVVENYAKKFNGRMKLSRTRKNSGSGAVPRNKSLHLSRGEYVFFLDANDLLTLNALEELYTLAKNFDADVVHIDKFYLADEALKDIQLIHWPTFPRIDKPTLESKSLTRRLEHLLQSQFMVTTWSKFARRDLMIENEIFFPPVKIGEDDVWTYGLLFCAKNFLRVPDALYIWRQAKQSVMRKEKTPQVEINFWLDPIVKAIKILDSRLNRIKFFRESPQRRVDVFKYFVGNKMQQLFNASLKMSTAEIYVAIKNNFGDKIGSHDVLISWLLADLITQQKIFVADRKKFAELEAQINKK